jgi:hypothetical protein
MSTFYCIIPVSALSEALISLCDQTSVESCRRSVDGNRAIVSYSSDYAPALLQSYAHLTQAEAIAEMNKAAWNPDATLFQRFLGFFQ